MGARKFRTVILIAALSVAPFLAAADHPQDRQPRQNQMSAARAGIITHVSWSEDGRYLDYTLHLKRYRFDLQTQKFVTPGEDTGEEQGRQGFRRGRGRFITQGDRRIEVPSRGHQYLTEMSPDGRWFAVCKDWNVVLESAEGGNTIAVTTDGKRKLRYGTANWTYGEELGQRHGMWWSPDSKKLIYYVFDERPVHDFYLIGNLTDINTTLMTEGYMKAGAPNPVVWLEIYDLGKRARIPVDCGQTERDQYIYNMRFTPDGRELLFNCTDRRQKELEVMALDIESGATRIVLKEKQNTWQENTPFMQFLDDGKRFIWETEKSGFRHYELRHLDGRLLNRLTSGNYPDMRIERVDEKDGWIFYTARSGENPLNDHLQRVRLDGTGQQTLTPQGLNHTSLSISPDSKWFVARYEDIQTPPSTALYRSDGGLVRILAQGPEKGNSRSEIFSFTAADGKTTLYGILHKPKDFDPNCTYPLIISVYGGPGSRAVYNRYMERGSRYNEMGILVAQIDNLGTGGRGKAFKDAVYQKLGDVDIRGQAEGVKYLRQRSYVDGSRVGIVGHSYGGYMAAMAIVKYPDVFTVAVDRAGVTDWRNYDSIYTERYMNLPQENPDGYQNGSVMPFVKNIKGKLLIMHGLVDDNVHPTNAFQLIDALDQAGISYESRFFPRADHGFNGMDTQDGFFKRWLLNNTEQ